MSNSARYSLNKNKYLLDPELERLEYLLKSHLSRDPRNCILLFLGLHTGARAMELLLLRRDDMNSHESSLFIRGLKGSNDREIPLPRWLFVELQHLAVKNQIGDSERLFPISYNRLRQIWEFYRPVQKKLHCLRHTFAIRLYRKTKDLRLVQVALGHRNITNTMVYADYLYSQQELRRLIL